LPCWFWQQLTRRRIHIPWLAWWLRCTLGWGFGCWLPNMCRLVMVSTHLTVWRPYWYHSDSSSAGDYDTNPGRFTVVLQPARSFACRLFPTDVGMLSKCQ
jgi:hypothetical protein